MDKCSKKDLLAKQNRAVIKVDEKFDINEAKKIGILIFTKSGTNWFNVKGEQHYLEKLKDFLGVIKFAFDKKFYISN